MIKSSAKTEKIQTAAEVKMYEVRVRCLIENIEIKDQMVAADDLKHAVAIVEGKFSRAEIPVEVWHAERSVESFEVVALPYKGASS